MILSLTKLVNLQRQVQNVNCNYNNYYQVTLFFLKAHSKLIFFYVSLTLSLFQVTKLTLKIATLKPS